MTLGSNSADVTVVLVAYDAEATVDRALATVAGQTTTPGAVLLVDDGSTDATTARAERWRDRLPLTVVALPTNQGVGVARGEALRRTETPLVAMLDADDAWLPHHLEVMVAEHAAGRLVVARDLHWSPGAWLRTYDRALPPPAEQLRELTKRNVSSAGVLFSRDDYEAAGGYRASLRQSEDWDLYLRMARHGTRLVLAEGPSMLYRISAGSLSAGYATAASDVQVLEHARDETSDDVERAWLERSLAHRRARLELAGALEAMRSGNAGEARRRARAALRGGDRRTRAIAAGLAAAPRTAARIRSGVTRRRWDSSSDDDAGR